MRWGTGKRQDRKQRVSQNFEATRQKNAAHLVGPPRPRVARDGRPWCGRSSEEGQGDGKDEMRKERKCSMGGMQKQYLS